MNFEYSDKVKRLQEKISDFMDQYVFPNEKTYMEQISKENRFSTHPSIMEELKAKAKAEGLWNLFLPDSEDGAGLSNIEYAPLCELMGGHL